MYIVQKSPLNKHKKGHALSQMPI